MARASLGVSGSASSLNAGSLTLPPHRRGPQGHRVALSLSFYYLTGLSTIEGQPS